jgi:hypothetical protein
VIVVGFTGPLVFDINELFDTDQGLRRQARTVQEAAADLVVDASGLPPDAQAVVASLGRLRGQLDCAVRDLTDAAADFGGTGSAAKKADSLLSSS